MSEETKHLKLPNETLFQFASMEIAALVPDPFKRFTLLKTIVFKLKQQAMRKTKPNPHSLELIVECMDKLVESASVIGESLSITMQNLQTRDDFKNTVQSQRDKFMRSLKDVVKWFRPLKSERIDKHLSISDQVDAVDTFRAACRDAIRNMNTKFNKKFTTFSERYAQEKKINMPDVTDNNDIEDVRLRVSNMYTQTYLPVPLSVWKNIKVGKSLQNAPLLPDQKAFQTIIDTVSRCESHVTYVKQRLETVSVQDGDVRPMLEYDDANKLEFNLGKQDVLRKVYPTLSDAELEDLPIPNVFVNYWGTGTGKTISSLLFVAARDIHEHVVILHSGMMIGEFIQTFKDMKGVIPDSDEYEWEEGGLRDDKGDSIEVENAKVYELQKVAEIDDCELFTRDSVLASILRREEEAFATNEVEFKHHEDAYNSLRNIGPNNMSDELYEEYKAKKAAYEQMKKERNKKKTEKYWTAQKLDAKAIVWNNETITTYGDFERLGYAGALKQDREGNKDEHEAVESADPSVLSKVAQKKITKTLEAIRDRVESILMFEYRSRMTMIYTKRDRPRKVYKSVYFIVLGASFDSASDTSGSVFLKAMTKLPHNKVGLIVDEAHNIRNLHRGSTRAKNVLDIMASKDMNICRVLELTATLPGNNVSQSCAVLDFGTMAVSGDKNVHRIRNVHDVTKEAITVSVNLEAIRKAKHDAAVDGGRPDVGKRHSARLRSD